MLDRFGCPFNRTPEGNLDFRRFGGTLYHRTAFCGAQRDNSFSMHWTSRYAAMK